MELIEENKRYTIVVSEKEYDFIKWCIDNKDDIDIVKPTSLSLTESPKKVKYRPKVSNEDEIPF